MTLVFGAVLLCSFGLDRLLSPAGDAVVSAVDGTPATLIGTIDTQTPGGPLVFHAGGATYALADPAVARRFAGHTVRISGVLHHTSGLLEIGTITPFLTRTAHAHSM